MLLSNITHLTTSEKQILVACRELICGVDPNAEIILYGSRARGDATEDSDYDLLIVSDVPATLKNEDRFRGTLYDIQLESGTVITVILANRAAWGSPLYKAMPLHQNITREGVSL